jgi:hypothetical protein
VKFFVLVFALSVPFWVVGAVTDLQLMPGLSVSALMAFCPMVAAAILVYREDRLESVAELLRRSLDFERFRAKAWYIPVLFLMPAVNLIVYAAMRCLEMPLPAPQIPVMASLLMSFGG